MRILRSVRRRLPDHDITVFSDSAGNPTPLQVVSMSPHVTRVVPVYAAGHARAVNNIRAVDREAMLKADLFIDAWGEQMFADASVSLDVPLFEILADRPELTIPSDALQHAAQLLQPFDGALFVALNLTTYGAALLRNYPSRIMSLLRPILDAPDVVVLNMFTSQYDFAHWPPAMRSLRVGRSLDENVLLREFFQPYDRVLPCIDLPITTIAALLSKCKYFVGVDNGVKHLAWALDVPRTYFFPTIPTKRHMLRWMPDFHRMLPFACADAALESHVAAALATLHRWRDERCSAPEGL